MSEWQDEWAQELKEARLAEEKRREEWRATKGNPHWEIQRRLREDEHYQKAFDWCADAEEQVVNLIREIRPQNLDVKLIEKLEAIRNALSSATNFMWLEDYVRCEDDPEDWVAEALAAEKEGR